MTPAQMDDIRNWLADYHGIGTAGGFAWELDRDPSRDAAYLEMFDIFAVHDHVSDGPGAAQLQEMRGWLADAPEFEGTDPADYLDADVVYDHVVLDLIEHRYIGNNGRGIGAFVADGATQETSQAAVGLDNEDADGAEL